MWSFWANPVQGAPTYWRGSRACLMLMQVAPGSPLSWISIIVTRHSPSRLK